MASFPGASMLMPSDKSDANTGAAAVMDTGTGNIVLLVASGLPATNVMAYCSSGDMLSSGIFAVGAEDPARVDRSGACLGIAIYRQNGTLVAYVTSVMTGHNADSTILVRGNMTSRFYAVVNDPTGVSTDLPILDDGGTVIQTQTLPVATANVWAIAPNRAGTILYHTTFNETPFVIHRWDLVNQAPLSDLVTGPTGYLPGFDGLHVLDDGTILIVVENTGTTPHTWELRRYNTSGVLQTTYALSTGGNFSPPEIGLNIPDLTSFWVKYFSTDGKTATIQKLKVSDFSVAATFTVGTLAGTGDVPVSCPVLVFPNVAVTYTTVTRIIRRLRRGPHVASQGFRVFHGRFLLDLQPGIGNVVDPAKTPEAMLRWSNNGGKTWSNEHWMSAGELGHYFQRLHVDRLGQARDRVYEVVVSDPVAWTLIGAFLDVEQGLN